MIIYHGQNQEKIKKTNKFIVNDVGGDAYIDPKQQKCGPMWVSVPTNFIVF